MIKNISFNFQLFDETNKSISKMPVNVQYFNMQENQWISIYSDVITKSKLNIEKKATSRAKALRIFLAKIKAFEIPELRIVPEKPIFNLKKQEVLSITYEFQLSKENTLLSFNFGTAWLLNKELIEKNDRFNNFYWITSPFASVNQKENLEKISILEKELQAFKNRYEKLDKTNANLNATLEKKNQEYDSLNAKNQRNLALAKERQAQVKKISKDLNTCNKAINKQQKRYENIKKESDDYKKTCEELKVQWKQKLVKLEEEINAKSKTIEELQSKLKECTAYKKDLKDKYSSEIARLEEAIKTKEETYIALENSYNELKENYNSQKNCEKIIQKFKHCQEDLKNCQEQYRNLEFSLENCKGEKTELKAITEKLVQEKGELDKHILTLNKEILSLQNKLEELSKEIVIEDRPVAVKNIYKNLVQEMDMATEQGKANSYSLANLSINLKGVINQDAEQNVGIQLFSKENANIINGNAISEISFDISPNPNQNIELGKVPDVLGLTETAVTRILESIGLKLNPVYQKSEKPNGASFRQTPEKDTPINPNEFVTVIFSKNE